MSASPVSQKENAAFRPFRYVFDPICLLGIGNYVLSRWILIPLFEMPQWWKSHWHDFWLIPAALPIILKIQRQLQWRLHDGYPSGREIMLHLVIWMVMCEGITPFFFEKGTADVMDLVAYTMGAGFAWIGWTCSSKTQR